MASSPGARRNAAAEPPETSSAVRERERQLPWKIVPGVVPAHEFGVGAIGGGCGTCSRDSSHLSDGSSSTVIVCSSGPSHRDTRKYRILIFGGGPSRYTHIQPPPCCGWLRRIAARSLSRALPSGRQSV